jgi:hypothetical protein
MFIFEGVNAVEMDRPHHVRITPACGMRADIPDQQLRAMRHQPEADADEDDYTGRHPGFDGSTSL